MAFNINFWKIDNENLIEVEKTKLKTEERLETWIKNDPSILGIDLLIIGRQVTTEHGGRIETKGVRPTHLTKLGGIDGEHSNRVREFWGRP